MRTFRWILCIPVAFLASIIAGAAGSWFATFRGESSWYGWLLSGVASAVAFFFVADRVAPAPSGRLNWFCVAIVSLLGTMSALGALMAGKDRISALAGCAMILCAISFTQRPTADSRSESGRPAASDVNVPLAEG